MVSRSHLAGAQVAVFVAGGVLAPVLHLAGHRPDHTHGAGGEVIALASGEDRRSEAGDLHDHAHPHPHPHPATEAGPGDEAQPVEPTHGHGSLAHFGLALLSGPPPLPLPLPERAGDVEVDASPHVAALFRPDFPLSRPPPVDATPS